MFETPAEAYDRYIGRYSADLARALIAGAGVQPGRSAVDVGCGPGALTGELVAVLGPERVGPAGAYATSLPAEQRTAVEEELRRRLEVGDGPFTLNARAWVAAGRA